MTCRAPERRHNDCPVARAQRGVALVTALLVVAVATVAAVALAAGQQIDIRRSANILNQAQAYAVTLGAEDWARHLLVRDGKKGGSDNLSEDWAGSLPPMEVEGGTVAGKIEDLQGRFNLNNLVLGDEKDNHGKSEVDFKRFRQLLEILEVDEKVAYAVRDWLDSDTDAEMNGAEDSEYSSAKPPYRAGNGLMVSVSELRAVKGVTPEIYEKLEPLVAALPVYVAVNVNTAQATVLRALLGNLTAVDAQRLIGEREKKPFDSPGVFLAHPVLAGRAFSEPEKKGIGTTSSYFMLHAAAEFGSGRFTMYSLLERGQNGKVLVLLRSQGVY